jgi:hypothetical protein
MLGSVFIEEEVREAVFEPYANGDAGLDGPSFMFYQTFCDIVKFDLIAMFNACHGDNLDLYKLNFAMITLITKENDARSMKNLSPISLLHFSFKISLRCLQID